MSHYIVRSCKKCKNYNPDYPPADPCSRCRRFHTDYYEEKEQ